MKFMIKCFEANYPESLGIVAVHNAPWVFQGASSQFHCHLHSPLLGIWKLIKGWLDPVVAAKINFTNNIHDLEAIIPRANILKELGGDDTWKYSYVEPVPGENDRLADTATRDKLLQERSEVVREYEELTKAWLKHDPSTPDAIDVQRKRDQVAETLRTGYWKLDPYVRARTLYDRTGVINEGGRIDFYPYRK